MIFVVVASIFLAIFCLGFGLYTLSDASRQAAVRRRLQGLADIPDVLDPTILREERMSSIGLMNRILNQFHVTRRIDHLLVQAGMEMTVSVFLLASVSLAGVVGLVTFYVTRHLPVGLLAATCAGLIPLLVVIVKKDRRVKAFSEHFPDALDMMVNALRAGFALSGAIEMVAEESPDPVSTEFRILFEEQKLGVDVKTAMTNFARRMDSTDAAYFVTAVVIQRDTGGNLAEVLDKIAYVIRDRFRILGEVRTFTAQGRLSGFILAVLPIVMALILTVLSPGYIQILLTDKMGSTLLTMAVCLQVIGFLVIRRIVSIKV